MLKGIAASGGFAVGKIFVLEQLKPEIKSHFSGEKYETERFENALEEYCLQTEKTKDSLRRIVGKAEADIFKGHIFIAKDPNINRDIKRKISMGFNAEMAAESACESYIRQFLASSSELTRQRAADIKDVKNGFINILCGNDSFKKTIPFGSVLAAKELTPSAVNFLDRRRTAAVVTETGSRASHLALLVRAMGIPAVLSVEGLLEKLKPGQRVIVDGNKGEVIEIN